MDVGEDSLIVPWTAKRSNQSILKEINPGYSLEGLMLKLKLPILWPPDTKSWLIWKDPDAGKDWKREKKGMAEDEMVGWHHWLNGHEFWVNSRSWWWTGRPGVLQFMGSQRVGHTWTNWTEEYVRACVGYFLCFCTSVGVGVSWATQPTFWRCSQEAISNEASFLASVEGFKPSSSCLLLLGLLPSQPPIPSFQSESTFLVKT